MYIVLVLCIVYCRMTYVVLSCFVHERVSGMRCRWHKWEGWTALEELGSS